MTMQTTHKITAAEAALGTHLPRGDVASALCRFGLPGRRHEAWRWSDLRAALDADQLGGADGLNHRKPSSTAAATVSVEPAPQATTSLDSALAGPEMALTGAAPLVLLNGALTPSFTVPQGTIIQQQHTLPPEENISNMAALVPALARQMAPSIIQMRVDAQVPTPIVIRHQASQKGAVASYLDIEFEPGAQATIIEIIDPQETGFANRYTKITLGEGAQATRIVVQSQSPKAVIIHHTDITVQKDTCFRQTALGFGARLARLETHLTYEAPGAATTLDGAYLITDNCHLDMTSHVDHAVPSCTTTQLVKGVANGAARGVFQGKFFVARDAQQTDAQMGHHGLMLSPDAELRAKPELEIYADDVACAHGNTMGALDETVLFYLQQRGLSAAAAKTLLVNAFLGEVLETLPDEEIRQTLMQLATKAMAAAL